MCGIAGYLGATPLSQEKISLALSLMQHRGPDHQAFQTFNLNGKHLSLLHARLSIIDLDPRSNQPFCIDDYALTYNGEIYNYLELREDLKKKKIALRTNSDTEVLLQYYILYGERCVDYFEGMWSFAIYDAKKGCLFLSRDRFGEKPLYYTKTKDGFFFGSEIKLLQALSGKRFDVNQTQLLRYLVNGYKSLYKTEETFYQRIHELPRASSLILDSNLREKRTRYWNPTFSIKKQKLDDIIEKFRECFLNSVKLRLRSDVPLAFCLSGGIDSSAIVSVASKVFKADVSTFSIVDPDPRYNEAENMKATVSDLRCKHTAIPLRHDNFFERINRLIRAHDGPISTISYYVHSYLSEAISQNGFKVVLSGTGADELLTGYYDHFLMHLYELKDSPALKDHLAAWEKHVKPLIRNPYLKDPTLFVTKGDKFRDHIYLDRDLFLGCLDQPFEEDFFEERYQPSLLRNRMLNELFHESIPVILHEDDLNSMMFSIENRSPYLDTNLFNYCYSIPVEFLIQDGYAKYILRQSMKGILNEKVRRDRKKVGFNASLASVLNLADKETSEVLLSDSPVFDLVRKSEVQQMLGQSSLTDPVNKFLFNFINAKFFLEL